MDARTGIFRDFVSPSLTNCTRSNKLSGLHCTWMTAQCIPKCQPTHCTWTIHPTILAWQDLGRHITAALFVADAAVKLAWHTHLYFPSLCIWCATAGDKVEYAEGHNINFTNPQQTFGLHKEGYLAEQPTIGKPACLLWWSCQVYLLWLDDILGIKYLVCLKEKSVHGAAEGRLFFLNNEIGR